MAEITTQADLEGMLSDPEKMSEYVKEKALDVLGSAVKEQMAEAFNDGSVSRPPMSDEAAVAEGTPIQGKGFGGGWDGGDDTKINLAKEAKVMDGQF